MPASFSYSAATALRTVARVVRAAGGFVLSRGALGRAFATTCSRAVVKLSPVFAMRARTRRFRSLFFGIGANLVQAGRSAPQQPSTQRNGLRCRPGGMPTFASRGPGLGSGRERFGAGRAPRAE